MVALGGGAVSYERGTPVQGLLESIDTRRPHGGPILQGLASPTAGP